MRLAVLFCLAAAVSSCGDDDSAPLDASTDARPFGCPSHPAPLANPGDDLGGDTWETFASGFFATWCTRCHASTLVGAVARGGAPDGFDWDDEASVREHLDLIREVVGVTNEMPPRGDKPSCDDRERLAKIVSAIVDGIVPRREEAGR